jgi:hypothetical protein
MQVRVKIKDIKTIHTDSGGRLDQPMIEVTLECNKVGAAEKHEIKFTEQLSNLAGMTDAQLRNYCQMLVEAYTKSAYKGQQELHPDTKDWNKQAQYIGQEFTIDV